MPRLIRRARSKARSWLRVSASARAMALCISAQSACICPRGRFESEKQLGTSTSLRASAGAGVGQELRAGRAAPQAAMRVGRCGRPKRRRTVRREPGKRRRRASARRRRSGPDRAGCPAPRRGSGSRDRAPRTGRGRSNRPECPTRSPADGCGRSCLRSSRVLRARWLIRDPRPRKDPWAGLSEEVPCRGGVEGMWHLSAYLASVVRATDHFARDTSVTCILAGGSTNVK